MKKLVVAGFSLLAVSLLVLGSQANVVGYQTVQASQQVTIKGNINQKDLLFQTICDLVNNKDIQKITITSQFNMRGFFSDLTLPTLTKKDIRILYLLGQFLSKSMSRTMIASMLQNHKIINPAVKKEITSVIDSDAKLTSEISQLTNTNSDCGCGNTTHYPLLICFALFCLMFALIRLGESVFLLILSIAESLDCHWYDWIFPLPPYS